jgi:hypothetical protein
VPPDREQPVALSAETLCIPAPSAVEKYVTSVFIKLDMPPTTTGHRRVLAVLKYLGT